MFVGLVHSLALLLLVAAVAKLRDAGSATVALRRAGVPSAAVGVRGLALAEASLAAAVLFVGGPVPAVALGLLHLGFAGFIVRLRRAAGATASCGCFGGSEAPAGRLHVVVNAAAAAGVAVALTDALPSAPTVFGDLAALAVPYGLAVAMAAWAIGLCLTSLPAVLAAHRPVTA